LLLLAGRDLRPRQRARDQRADTAGLDLKRRILQELIDRDPEPAEVATALFTCIDRFGPPFGPTRAVAALVHEEWQAACVSPDWTAHVLAEALDPPAAAGEGRTNG
jgi:hypothetical protein